MQESVRSADRHHVDSSLSVAVATRVTSVIPVFFGRLAGVAYSDTFDINQGIESKWRELGGAPPSGDLEQQVVANLPRFRDRALGSGVAGAAVVAAAIDVVTALLAPLEEGRDRLPQVSAGALRVALGMDGISPPPTGATSWLAFELRGQAELVDLVGPRGEGVSQDLLFEVRNESGAQSMTYRNAMKALLRP
ncbi:hypothetical protein GA0070618_0494 [Micromonospora echinospora]|uniref:Uncharacterized protein n=2 Tax=Micromonospora echinospora TaxID=1877 RepID=A0A1C4UN01_MICEC|nr:hypothetical protein GA0070618_0494 [Micromonospora echinospora]